MLTPPNINKFFDLDEEIQESDMNLNDNNIDYEVVDDNNLISEKTLNTEKVKIFLLSESDYITWIKSLEKQTEWWFCHHYGIYKSIAEENSNKNPELRKKNPKNVNPSHCVEYKDKKAK
ncbi:16229_t:CDS:2 [Cetraspora pellucida]|uniref:16229_t:CDS:1 n=1 Tax=Cetraspora pellucida TaxID=1433469 RepID=A0A9N9AQ54_9GLOM|nr:16229_t:CDS:2 [Cetraspora pellucida]